LFGCFHCLWQSSAMAHRVARTDRSVLHR
jgi:hypothetical protein